MDARKKRSRAEVAKKRIQERLESIDKRLASAEAYVEKGVNVRGTEDWSGLSGHPKWTKSTMVPRNRERRARLEKKLDRIASREQDRSGRKRRAT